MTKTKARATAQERVDVVEFAKAIADATRRHIMKLCCGQRLAVSEITEQIGMFQLTVSHHLAILRDAGLVTIE